MRLCLVHRVVEDLVPVQCHQGAAGLVVPVKIAGETDPELL